MSADAFFPLPFPLSRKQERGNSSASMEATR